MRTICEYKMRKILEGRRVVGKKHIGKKIRAGFFLDPRQINNLKFNVDRTAQTGSLRPLL